MSTRFSLGQTRTRCCVGLLLAVACGDDRARTESRSTSQADDPAVLVMDSLGVGPFRLCTSLDSLRAAYGPMRDTVYVGEDGEASWPVKALRLAESGELTFEGNLDDSSRVSTIRTTSAFVVTPAGNRVGDSVTHLVAKSDSLLVELPEGMVRGGCDMRTNAVTGQVRGLVVTTVLRDVSPRRPFSTPLRCPT